MTRRILIVLLLAAFHISIQPESQAQQTPKTRGINTQFESYAGKNHQQQEEEALIRALTAKFTLLQAAVGAVAGGNRRGTHANGFCLDGELEIYEQPAENAWLKIGPFAKPLKLDQRPKVRVRFADGSGKPQSNWVPDVRSISISFEVDGKRQDFSMNNDPVFTFGNLIDMNNFMSFQLIAATLPPAKTQQGDEAIAILMKDNPEIAMSVKKVMELGASQQRKEVYAYHTENYYSCGAFQFGAKNAAKFKLVRCGQLPPVREPLPPDANDRTLVERTTNAINGLTVKDDKNDKRNECWFELQVEILDVEKMKPPIEGKKLSAIEWVEDATLNWTAAGAQSYSLGKLTFIPGSIKSPYECENAPAFDVNTNCWEELKPLGQMNRGRYAVERQSQRMRSHQVTTPSPPTTIFQHSQPIEQGWNYQARDTFWYLPQGSYIIPFDWFMTLTDPETNRPLHERDNLERFGFIHDDYEGYSPLNPAKLPIGITRESPPGPAFGGLRDKGDWLGITCSACHVGAVTHNGTRFIIDGAPSPLDFQKFSMAIERALDSLKDPSHFENFRATLAKQGVAVTREGVEQVRQRMAQRNTRTFFHFPDRRGNQTVDAGPGRTDAFGVILNEVVSRSLGVPGNATVASAPVSFPHIWDAPQQEWVQYSGLSNNAFTRNVGEVLGVFGDVILDPKSPDFLATTARFDNLQILEDKLRSLKPPQWVQVFGPFSAEEQQQIKRGKEIFHHKKCSDCHPDDAKTVNMKFAGEFRIILDAERKKIQNITRNEPTNFVGTDPQYFANLKKSWLKVDMGPLQGTSVLGVLAQKDGSFAETLKGFRDHVAKNYPKDAAMTIAALKLDRKYEPQDNAVQALADTTLGIGLKYMQEKGIPMEPTDEKYKYMTGGDLPARQTHEVSLKARSLHGIAFSGPYFHNGSVRTLRGVLSPADRETSFYVGGTGYDQKNGGYENAGSYLFRADKLGNLSIGHDFSSGLTAEEKEDLLMYLKSL